MKVFYQFMTRIILSLIFITIKIISKLKMRKKYTSKFSFNMFVIRDLTKKIMKKNMFKIYC